MARDAVTAQAGDEGQCFAMAMRHLGDQALTFGATSVQPRHVRLRPGFVDENQPPGGGLLLVPLPLPPPARDVRAIPFAGADRSRLDRLLLFE
jgi:hypothetical protein